jgi:hypothetical protein
MAAEHQRGDQDQPPEFPQREQAQRAGRCDSVLSRVGPRPPGIPRHQQGAAGGKDQQGRLQAQNRDQPEGSDRLAGDDRAQNECRRTGAAHPAVFEARRPQRRAERHSAV